MLDAIIDLQGQRFGNLLVIRMYGQAKDGQALWECKCDCGNTEIVFMSALQSGKWQKCRQKNHNRERKTPGEITRIAENQIYLAYKHGARIRGIKFDLSKEDISSLTSLNCYYCGCVPSNMAKINRKDHTNDLNYDYKYNGIDRIDSSKGYTLDNVVPCCKKCNYAKSVMSLNEFFSWVDQVYRYLHQNINQDIDH